MTAEPPTQKRESYLPKIHRALPQSIDAEKGVLGSVLYAYSIRGKDVGRELMTNLESQVSTSYFHLPAHKTVWRTIKQMHRDNEPLDFITLTEILDSEGNLEQCGGAAAVTDLFSFINTDANVMEYVEILKEKHGLRVIASLSETLSGESLAHGATPQQIAENAISSLQAIVSSGSGQPKKSCLSFRSINELMHMEFDDSDNYFGDRIIAASQPITLLGPGGIGKSRLLTQLAFCMITGRPFLEIETHARNKKWLIFQTENSNRRIKADIAKMIMAMRFQKEDVRLIDDCFRVHTIEKDEDTFLDLENPRELEEIQRAIEEFNPDFVAFDPLNTFTSLELNNDKDMKQVVTTLSRVVKRGNPQRVPVVVHHSLTGKIGAAKAVGWDKGSYGRNSKSLYAWTRAQINLAPQDPDNPNLLIMACGKNNNGAHFPEIGLMLDEKTGIYQINPDFDAEEFRQNVGLEKKTPANKKTCLSSEDVADLFEDQISRTELLERIKNLTGCGKSVAYETLAKAEKARAIIRGRLNKYNPVYTKPEPENPQSEF